jgi:hypothetical protein
MATTASSPDDKNISSKDNTKSDISQNNDNDEHGTMRVVRSGSTSQENNKLLASGENYFSIHFSGCGKCYQTNNFFKEFLKNLLPNLFVLNSLFIGFMLPYHFGVVAALKDFNVSFSKVSLHM